MLRQRFGKVMLFFRQGMALECLSFDLIQQNIAAPALFGGHPQVIGAGLFNLYLRHNGDVLAPGNFSNKLLEILLNPKAILLNSLPRITNPHPAPFHIPDIPRHTKPIGRSGGSNELIKITGEFREPSLEFTKNTNGSQDDPFNHSLLVAPEIYEKPEP